MCRTEIERVRKREARLQISLSAAQAAAARSDWTTLIALTEDVNEIDPGNAVAAALQAEARRQLHAKAPDPDATIVVVEDAHEISPAPAPSAAPAFMGDHSTRQTDQRLAGGTARLPAAELPAAAAGPAPPPVLADQHDRRSGGQPSVAERAARETHDRRVDNLLRKATECAEQKDYEKALGAITELLAIEPAHAEAAALRARFSAEQGAQQAATAAASLRQRRLRAAAPALRAAESAFAAGDFDRARWSAEAALALAPECAEATGLLARIAAATPAAAADDDDTVKLNDPNEETARLFDDSPSLDARTPDPGGASGWMDRWRRSWSGKSKER